MANARLAIDIGGTFTDVALDTGAGTIGATKVLTTHKAPVEGVIDGVLLLLGSHGLGPGIFYTSHAADVRATRDAGTAL